MKDSRWILAFDGSCAKCTRISDLVAAVAGDRLDTRPLTDADVIRWRHDSLGPAAPWRPTLIRVTGGRAKSWTGPALAVPMARVLGPRATVRVLRVLGEFAAAESVAQRSPDGVAAIVAQGPSRRGVLLAGSGAVLAGWLVLGRGAGSAEASSAHRWVQENLGSLPQDLDGIAQYPMTYRRAAIVQLPAEAQSRLWTEHLARARAARERLSTEQDAALRRIEELAADPATFRGERTDELATRLDAAAARVEAEFGRAQARRIVGVLGPDTEAGERTLLAKLPDCECSAASSHCGDARCVGLVNGCNKKGGCGTLWRYECNGRCA
ncbi:bacteriocin fulvocin C-related protein [Nocardia vulneris]|uniref:bacteriocin fulvocin C-related protein n=1 Tax=Nocardia vulneris TaxID=1141657 RepID=UPI0030D49A0C